MSTDFLTPGRVKPLGRLLALTFGFGILLAVLSVPLMLGDYVRYGTIVLVIAAAFCALSGLAIRAVRAGDQGARRLSIITGVLLVVLSVPLVALWIGLLTAITGIGLLVIVLGPERRQP